MYKPYEVYYNKSIYNEPNYMKLLLTHWSPMLLIYTLKTLENVKRFSDVFRGTELATAGSWVKVNF